LAKDHQKDDYLKVNPYGYVPALKEGDFGLFESSAILKYIASKYGDDHWYPKDL